MTNSPEGMQLPPYAAETAREIRTLGPGGTGLFESSEQAGERGVDRTLADQVSDRKAHGDAAPAGEAELRVREKAHELWVLEGKPDGQASRHLEMAGALLAAEQRERRLHAPPTPV